MSGYINIVFSGIAEGTLRMHGSRGAIVYNCDLQLNFGNISNVEDYNSRLQDYINLNYNYENPEEFVYQKEIFDEIMSLKEEDKPFRIWASQRYSNDICNLYFIIFLLYNKTLYLVDIPESENGEKCDVTDFMEQLPEETDIKIYKLSLKDKAEYILKWYQLVEENGDIRIFENGKIKSLNYSDCTLNIFDWFPQPYLHLGTVSLNEVVGHAAEAQNSGLDYTQIQAITKHMLDTNELTIVDKELVEPYYREYDFKVRKTIS